MVILLYNVSILFYYVIYGLGVVFLKKLRRRFTNLSPQRAILLYYFLALAAATLLLSLPVFYRTDGISFIDTLFVAASSISVTGLSTVRSEEHTSELQSRFDLVFRLV